MEFFLNKNGGTNQPKWKAVALDSKISVVSITNPEVLEKISSNYSRRGLPGILKGWFEINFTHFQRFVIESKNLFAGKKLQAIFAHHLEKWFPEV